LTIDLVCQRLLKRTNPPGVEIEETWMMSGYPLSRRSFLAGISVAGGGVTLA